MNTMRQFLMGFVLAGVVLFSGWAQTPPPSTAPVWDPMKPLRPAEPQRSGVWERLDLFKSAEAWDSQPQYGQSVLCVRFAGPPPKARCGYLYDDLVASVQRTVKNYGRLRTESVDPASKCIPAISPPVFSVVERDQKLTCAYYRIELPPLSEKEEAKLLKQCREAVEAFLLREGTESSFEMKLVRKGDPEPPAESPPTAASGVEGLAEPRPPAG